MDALALSHRSHYLQHTIDSCFLDVLLSLEPLRLNILPLLSYADHSSNILPTENCVLDIPFARAASRQQSSSLLSCLMLWVSSLSRLSFASDVHL